LFWGAQAYKGASCEPKQAKPAVVVKLVDTLS
jgi:hypothetical protein